MSFWAPGIDVLNPYEATTTTTKGKQCAPWSEEDDVRQEELFCYVEPCCSKCVFKKKANAENLVSCAYWCERYPAEARKIMDKMEGVE